MTEKIQPIHSRISRKQRVSLNAYKESLGIESDSEAIRMLIEGWAAEGQLISLLNNSLIKSEERIVNQISSISESVSAEAEKSRQLISRKSDIIRKEIDEKGEANYRRTGHAVLKAMEKLKVTT